MEGLYIDEKDGRKRRAAKICCDNCGKLPMYDTKEKGQELSISIGLYGVGAPNLYSTGSTEKYAIDFIPLKDLLDLEIRLNPQIDVLFEDDLQDVKFSAKKKFSVADLAIGIFWHLTWDGGPKEKAKVLEELRL